jgi:hypothetical protein
MKGQFLLSCAFPALRAEYGKDGNNAADATKIAAVKIKSCPLRDFLPRSCAKDAPICTPQRNSRCVVLQRGVSMRTEQEKGCQRSGIGGFVA